jgi:hypothetical protein
VEVEYGCVGNVRFLNPENVRMCDGEGNTMLCKCGKPARSGAFGKDAYVVWCEDCVPLSKEQVKFVLRETKNDLV